jgi:chemotaxis protein methyltransferase CheR
MSVALRKPEAGPQELSDVLSIKDFNRIAQLVESTAGIRLPPVKKLMIEGRLRKRVRAHGLNNFEDYCELLFDQNSSGNEMEYLIDSVTTNKTDFFREPAHFKFLQNKALPDLVAARRHEGATPNIKVWSAASSNGAEAYTLAMVLHEQMEMRKDFRFAILGTDISSTVLEQGRRAIYPAQMMEPVPERMMKRYVMTSRKPEAAQNVRMAPNIRRYVQFAHLNLMDQSYSFDRDVDVIFLRNVLIYFDKKDQEDVVSRLYGHLRKGGYLFLGHSESMVGNTLNYHQVSRAVFQKA